MRRLSGRLRLSLPKVRTLLHPFGQLVAQRLNLGFQDFVLSHLAFKETRPQRGFFRNAVALPCINYPVVQKQDRRSLVD